MDKDMPVIERVAKVALEKYLNENMGHFPASYHWKEEETDAMRRYLLLRKKLGRDVQPEDMRSDGDQRLLDTMVVISKKFPKKEIAKKMREQLKELGLGKGDF